MCGENSFKTGGAISPGGTPPRVWGKLLIAQSRLLTSRYTPTCVGKTSSETDNRVASSGTPPRVWGKLMSHLLQKLAKQVHPHVCGENYASYLHKNRGKGTPPRVWGKHVYDERDCRDYRYTPTCVGKTSVWRLVRPSVKVHPHVCGENHR